MIVLVKSLLKRVLPPRVVTILGVLKDWRDLWTCLRFLLDSRLPASFVERLSIVRNLFIISFNVESPHSQRDALSFIREILAIPKDRKGVLVEAGCYKGSSTAKFSIAAKLAGRELVVFDSFQGIPENDEPHDRNIFGGVARFREGDYRGSLQEVTDNVTRFGEIGSCRFVEGWFEATMPGFHEPVVAAYLDVDLVSSTRTCLKYLYPLLADGGGIYSQDGHLPLVIGLLDDSAFWERELAIDKPFIDGLGVRKLVVVRKG